MLSEKSSSTEQSAAIPRRIMIVEDEFLIRLTLAEVLADEGYEVLEAESGDDAVTLLDEVGEIAVLLTDIQLPGTLDGLALVEHARRGRPNLPVIFMTGRPDTMASQPSHSREMFVAKPYLPSEICLAVKRMLAEP